MPGKDCPNYINCQLINKEDVLQDKSQQRQYIRDFCLGGDEAWGRCKRYMTKQELNFCPDFVLPDSPGGIFLRSVKWVTSVNKNLNCINSCNYANNRN